MSVNQELHDYVLFDLGGRRYALPVEQVLEVVPLVGSTPAPAQRPGFRGLVNLRGVHVPVLDLAQALGGAPAELTLQHKLLIADGGARVALVVDDVVGAVRMAPGAPDDRVDASQVRAIGLHDGQTVLVLALAGILSVNRDSGAQSTSRVA